MSVPCTTLTAVMNNVKLSCTILETIRIILLFILNFYHNYSSYFQNNLVNAGVIKPFIIMDECEVETSKKH